MASQSHRICVALILDSLCSTGWQESWRINMLVYVSALFRYTDKFTLLFLPCIVRSRKWVMFWVSLSFVYTMDGCNPMNTFGVYSIIVLFCYTWWGYGWHIRHILSLALWVLVCIFLCVLYANIFDIGVPMSIPLVDYNIVDKVILF
jgi:hypothetical protein